MNLDRLGIQAHCLRHLFAAGFEHGLSAVADRGLRVLELVSFPGCRGNAWGDFGLSTDLPAREIGARLAAAGISCPSVMVNERELAPERAQTTLRWVSEVGCQYVALSSFAHPDEPTLADWQRCFEELMLHAARCADAGLRFVVHTQPSLWRLCRGHLPANLLLHWADPRRCLIEYDPSGAIIYGLDPATYLEQRPEVFYALHLRDGSTPAEPVFYLPSAPLGTGGINWTRLLAAAAATAIQWYLIEMELLDREAVLDAVDTSLSFLETGGFVPGVERLRRARAAPLTLSDSPV